MTTTSPSWFPSWPSGFRDIEDAYVRTIPRQWPRGLYDKETDEYRDLEAIAVVLSWVAQGGEWIKQRIYPQYDSGSLFLALWEECLGLAKRGTIALRQAAIIGWLRMIGGNAKKAALQKIFAPIFDEDDPADILFSYSTLAQAVTAAPDSNEGWAQVLNTLHIYSANNNEPDWKAMWDMIRLLKPPWQRWGGGPYQQLKYDTQGGYNTACYA